jgi:hypothetical protein
MTDPEFWRLQRTLAFEFSKYVLAHPEIDAQIPEGAQVVFLLEGEDRFNALSRRQAAAQHEKGQPVVLVRVKGLRPPLESRLISPELELAKRP